MQAYLPKTVALFFVAALAVASVTPASAIECVRVGGTPGACVEAAGHCLCNFENLPEGHILDSADFPPSVTLSVLNNVATHPDEAIVFDSSCPGGCSGGDTDLETPSAGPGNDTAQGKVMVIAENITGAGDDGLVDDPDDEHGGGTITFTFGVPYKLLSLKALDHERPDQIIETPSRIEMDTVGGGVQFVDSLLLGDSSLETIVVPSPQPSTEIRLVHFGSGGFDDIELVCACGDRIQDDGEECDPPASLGGEENCSDECTFIQPECGDGEITGDEECDPPAAQGGLPDCRDDCTLTVCGDGITEGTEACDPPGDFCRADCTIPMCGDDVIDPGEDCDPPESAGGVAGCLDDCTMDPGPQCGDGEIDDAAGEECDPPDEATGCNDNCMLSVCGDGEVEAGEECDPPSVDAGCNDDCTFSECGDGVTEAGEECDPPDEATGCNQDCSLSDCGDDEVEAGEECEPPGVGDCSDECTLIICGDGIVEGDEECDPPSVGDCRDDCTMMRCGDEIQDPGEECDPPESQGGVEGCQDDCTLVVCGDGEVESPEECDPGTEDPLCRDDCTVIRCGDGIKDPGEECEPPSVGNCRADCTLIVCGDRIKEGTEQCDPPLTEICNNMIDDDGDNLADCQDPKCLNALNAMVPVCNEVCVLEPVGCTPIFDDPAVIYMSSELERSAGQLDYFKVHGRVLLDPPFAGGPIDPVTAGFGVTMRNAHGEIYSAELLPGDFIARTQKRFRYKDRNARLGDSKRNGLYAVLNRFRRFEGAWYYVFSIKAYADFSGATVAEMTTQVYGVDGPGYMTVEWTESPRGWKLRRKDFAD